MCEVNLQESSRNNEFAFSVYLHSKHSLYMNTQSNILSTHREAGNKKRKCPIIIHSGVLEVISSMLDHWSHNEFAAKTESARQDLVYLHSCLSSLNDPGQA